MNVLTENIQARAKVLLSNGTVESVLGFCRGTLPMARRPFLARTPEEADQLCWDEFCLLNLAAFLPTDSAGRTAIFTKGCDWRNLVVHRLEGRLPDRLYIIGISCTKMLDPEKINGAAGGSQRVLDVVSGADGLRVQTPDGTLLLQHAELYREACLACRCNSPGAADEWLASPAEWLPARRADVDPLRHLDSEQRAAHYRTSFRNCLMCFACRDVCPLCYCKKCFVDIEKAHYLATTDPLGRVLDFHFQRAHHIAGRCTGCGACESACPMNIPVSRPAAILNGELEQATGYVPGCNPDEAAPAGIFRPSYHEPDRRRS